MEEKKDAMQALIDRAAPLARRFLEEPELMEKLKASSPWFSEEALREELEDIISLTSEKVEGAGIGPEGTGKTP